MIEKDCPNILLLDLELAIKTHWITFSSLKHPSLPVLIASSHNEGEITRCYEAGANRAKETV